MLVRSGMSSRTAITRTIWIVSIFVNLAIFYLIHDYPNQSSTDSLTFQNILPEVCDSDSNDKYIFFLIDNCIFGDKVGKNLFIWILGVIFAISLGVKSEFVSKFQDLMNMRKHLYMEHNPDIRNIIINDLYFAEHALIFNLEDNNSFKHDFKRIVLRYRKRMKLIRSQSEKRRMIQSLEAYGYSEFAKYLIKDSFPFIWFMDHIYLFKAKPSEILTSDKSKEI